MCEPVSAGDTALDEERGGDSRIHQVEQRIFVDIRQLREEVDVEFAADHRSERQDAQRLIAEARDPSTDDIAHAARQSDLFEFPRDGPAAVLVNDDPSALAEMAEQLAGEERVAVRLASQRVREPDPIVVKVVTSCGREQLDEVGVLQPFEREAGDVGFPMQVGQADC